MKNSKMKNSKLSSEAVCNNASVGSIYRRRYYIPLIVGVVLSVVLIQHYAVLKTGFQLGPSECNFSQSFNCDDIARSSFAAIAGVPLGSFALAFYLSFLSLLFIGSGLAGKEDNKDADVGLFFSTLAMLISIVLAGISIFVIRSTCIYCAGLYLVNIVLFLISVFHPTRTKGLYAAIINGLTTAIVVILPFSGDRVVRQIVYPVVLLSFFFSVALPAAIIDKFYMTSVTRENLGEIVRMSTRLTQEQTEEEAHWYQRWAATEAVDIPIADGDFRRGPDNALLRIVEFADFECPACLMAGHLLHEFYEQHPTEVQIVYRSFPLDRSCNRIIRNDFHQYACDAAEVARCAGRLDKGAFWQMHDFFYATQGLSAEDVQGWSSVIDVDASRMKACLVDDLELAAVKADIEQGISLKIGGTPAIFVNGRILPGSVNDLKAGRLNEILENIKSR
ncbi:MAG: vitamin K epoxide reductase family protein [bacterium]|nr:vitamin K epoxide reductase family protein [bacterium]